MTAKEIFLRHGDDVKAMLGVVSNPAFDRACIYAKQSWLERAERTSDPVKAINEFLDALRDLPIDPGTVIAMPGPKLHHNLDVGPRLSKHPRKNKKQ